jgi:hypothetical protein
VHGLEFAGSQAIHHHQDDASGHERGRGPVNAQEFEDDEKNDEGRPFE